MCYKPEEDNGTVKDTGKVKGCMGIAFGRCTFTEVAEDTLVLLRYFERICSAGSWQQTQLYKNLSNLDTIILYCILDTFISIINNINST